MTPKEKAKEIFDKMYGKTPVRDEESLIELDRDRDTAIQCALVAVDEILHNFGLTTNGQTFFTEHRAVEFYKQVQQEIENL